MMVSGLVLRIESGSRWNWEEVDGKEDFGDLGLGNKYGFDLGWYVKGERIHIIWRYVSGWETQIYLSDNEAEAREIFRELVTEQLDEVDEDDEK